MKKILSFSFIIALIGFNISCKKKEVDKLTEFNIDYTTNLTIPTASMTVSNPSLTPITVEFTTPNVPTQQATKFSEAGTAQNLIDKIVMTRFNISATGSGTTTPTLDYLNSINIYIKASGVGEAMIAGKSNIPDGISSVAMDLQDVNIKEYIFKDNIQFRVLATFDATTPTNQTLKMDETVHVSAKLLK
ncbi:MAG: hypothetical protein K0S53_1760 [Bacteroidetes bacterium]|jgi:hypothetical protein|nr:hypothetical protein [Bacteroidota bacterium]MDF2453803.1 hypothetical protein [Bacteroidota bacterium]